MKRTFRLLKPIGLSWLAFLVVGVAIALFFPIPSLTVVIDRSYCPTNQWQQIAQTYDQLYEQHDQKKLVLEQVVMVSDLGQDVFETPPKPDVIRQLSTYGKRDGDRLSALQQKDTNVRLISCFPPS